MPYANFNEDPSRGLLPGDDLKDMLEELSTMTDIGMKASISSSLDALVAMFQSLSSFFLKPILTDGSIMTVDNSRGITVIDEGLQFIIKYPSVDIESIKIDGVDGTFSLGRYGELLENNFYNVRYENGVFQPASLPQISKNLSIDDILTNINNISTVKNDLTDFLANKVTSEDYNTQATTLQNDLGGILNAFKALYISSDYTELREKYAVIEANNSQAVTENINKGNILIDIGGKLDGQDTIGTAVSDSLAELKTVHEDEVLPIVANILPTIETWKTKIVEMETVYKNILPLTQTVTEGVQNQLTNLAFEKAKLSYNKILTLYLDTIDLDTSNTSDVNIDALETLRVSIDNTRTELDAIVLSDYLDKESETSETLITTIVSDNANVLSSLQARVSTIVADHQRIRSELGGDDRALLDAALDKATQLQADIQACMTTLSDNAITNVEFQKLKTISDNIGILIDNTTLVNEKHLTAINNITIANQSLIDLTTAENRMDALASLDVSVQSKLTETTNAKVEWYDYVGKCSTVKKLPTEIEYIRQKLDLDAPFVFNNLTEKETLSKVVIEHLIQLNHKKATLNIPTFKHETIKGSGGEIWQNIMCPIGEDLISVEGLQGPTINTNTFDNDIEFVGSTGFISGQLLADGTMFIKLSDEYLSVCHHRTPPTIKVLTSTGNILPVGFITDYNVSVYDSLAYDDAVPTDGYYTKTIPIDTGSVDTIPGIDAGQTVTYLRTGFKDGDVIIIVSNNGSTSTTVGCQSDFGIFRRLLAGGTCKLTCNSDGTAFTIEAVDTEFGIKNNFQLNIHQRVSFNGAIYTYNGPRTNIVGVEVMECQLVSTNIYNGKMIIKAMSNGLALTYDHELFKVEIHNFHNNTTRYIVLGDNPNWANVTSFYLAQNETTMYYTMNDNFIYKIDGINAVPSFLSGRTYNTDIAPLTTTVTDYNYVSYKGNEITPHNTGESYNIGDLIAYDVIAVDEDDGSGTTVTNYYPDNVRLISAPPLPFSLKIDAGRIGELLVDDEYVVHTDYTVASILNVNYGYLYPMGNVPTIYANPSYHVYGDGFQCYKGHLFVYSNHTEVHNLLLDKQIVFYENILDRVKSSTIV